MRIGVVSDTHLGSSAAALPRELVQGLNGVDYILHAGDWVSEAAADLLQAIAPLDGVAGNNDGFEIRERFGLSKVVELGTYRIGIVHGHGGRSTPDTAFAAFCDSGGVPNVDIIVFGHSHIPFSEWRQGTLLFNPGSPTDKRRQPLYSYGILELKDIVQAEHRFYADRNP